MFLLVFSSKLPVVRLLFPKRQLPREWRVRGDFLWMLDHDIAATMIAATVVGVGADNKGFVVNSSGRARQGVSQYVSSELE